MTPGKDEMIFPITQAVSLIVGRVFSSRSLHRVKMSSAIFSVSETIMFTEFSTYPKNSTCCDGEKTDLSGWIINPRESNREDVSNVFFKQSLCVFP